MRPFFPREHGLWSWVFVPLTLPMLLSPSLGMALAVVAATCVFLGGNAWRAGAPGLAAMAGAAAFLSGLGAGWGLGVALPIAAGAVLMMVAAAYGMAALGARRGSQVEGRLGLQLVVIVGFGAVAWMLAVAGGTEPGRAALAVAAVVAFEVTGLWWVRGQLAPLLPGRAPWKGGAAVAVAAAGLVLAAGLAAGHPLTAGVPLLYAGRILVTRAPTSARDARRIGLSEAAWGVAAAVLAVVGVG